MLTSTSGNKWKALRSVMSPTFSSGKLKFMFHLVQRKSERLMQFLEENIKDSNSVVDLTDAFGYYTMDVIGSCAFGMETNLLGDENKEFYAASRNVSKFTFKMIVKTFCFMLFPSFSRKIGIKLNSPSRDYLVKITKNTIEQRDGMNKRGDFLDLMLDARSSSKSDGKNMYRVFFTGNCGKVTIYVKVLHIHFRKFYIYTTIVGHMLTIIFNIILVQLIFEIPLRKKIRHFHNKTFAL